jgi:hypothetical protein
MTWYRFFYWVGCILLLLIIAGYVFIALSCAPARSVNEIKQLTWEKSRVQCTEWISAVTKPTKKGSQSGYALMHCRDTALDFCFYMFYASDRVIPAPCEKAEREE